jgi:hypothetical protein
MIPGAPCRCLLSPPTGPAVGDAQRGRSAGRQDRRWISVPSASGSRVEAEGRTQSPPRPHRQAGVRLTRFRRRGPDRSSRCGPARRAYRYRGCMVRPVVMGDVGLADGLEGRSPRPRTGDQDELRVRRQRGAGSRLRRAPWKVLRRDLLRRRGVARSRTGCAASAQHQSRHGEARDRRDIDDVARPPAGSPGSGAPRKPRPGLEVGPQRARVRRRDGTARARDLPLERKRTASPRSGAVSFDGALTCSRGSPATAG